MSTDAGSKETRRKELEEELIESFEQEHEEYKEKELNEKKEELWNEFDENKDNYKEFDKYVSRELENYESYLDDKDNTWYEKPDNVVGVFVNPITGELADGKTTKRKIFYYLKGSEPLNLQNVFQEMIE